MGRRGRHQRLCPAHREDVRRPPRAGGEAVRLHLLHLGLSRGREAGSERRDRGAGIEGAGERGGTQALRPAEGALREDGRAVDARPRHHHPARAHRRSRRSHRPLHLLAGPHRSRRRSARPGNRRRSGAVRRRARSRRLRSERHRERDHGCLQRHRSGEAASDEDDAGVVAQSVRKSRDADLGAGAVPRRAQGQPVGRHAGVDGER